MNSETPIYAERVGPEIVEQLSTSEVLIFLTVASILFFFCVVTLAGLWKIFQKADEPGINSVVPLLNLFSLVKIANKPDWWIALFFFPLVNTVVYLLLTQELAKKFGKTPQFGFGLFMLPFIFYPILGFDDSQYQSNQNSKNIYTARPY